ncbi:RNase adapter RapZ [Alphaproteobacteria bacterium]|jgi:UPF0042 nucleotide-binding protein|nr:RNase adapter RapZ [Alphaproteobacteria bacterium]
MGERVVLVTGMSGAGRTATLKVLEDLGYEAVDNLPLSMLERLVDLPEQSNLLGGERPLAIGIDLRTRDFAVELVIDEVEQLASKGNRAVTSIFVDCDDAVLVRRYTETRRRHPLDADRPLPDTIKLERSLLVRLRSRADLIVDTTESALAELKEIVAARFALDRSPGLNLCVTSFSFRHGVPREADLVFDVRFLRNPHYKTALRDRTGEDDAVQRYIKGDPDLEIYVECIKSMLGLCLPRYQQEGKSYLTIAIGCTGGRHRSVYVAIELSEWLEKNDWAMRLRHRDMHLNAGRDMA